MVARGRVKGATLEKVTSGVLAAILAALVIFFCYGLYVRENYFSSSNSLALADANSATTAASQQQQNYSKSSSKAASDSDAAGSGSSGSNASRAASDAVTAGATESASAGNIAVNSKKRYTLTYEWEGISSSASVCNYLGMSVALDLPSSTQVREGDEFFVNPLYSSGTKVYEFNQSGVLTGWYTFSGWYMDDVLVAGSVTMPNEDVVLTGQWEYQEKSGGTIPSVTEHEVVYTWTGLPTASACTLYTDKGTPQVVSLPENTTCEQGEPYSIDAHYYPGLTLYAYNEHGFKSDSYTFMGWNLNGSLVYGVETMGSTNVTLSGVWVHAEIATPKVVSYQWSDAPDQALELFDEQGRSVHVSLPAEAVVNQGESYALDTTYTPGMKLYRYSAEGYALMELTFGGWLLNNTLAPAEITVGTSDLTFTGAWNVRMITHQAAYAWSWEDEQGNTIDAPSDTQVFYDEDGHEIAYKVVVPETVSKAPGTFVTVDTRFTNETVLYVHDSEGKVVGRYEFSGWSQQGEILLEEEDIEITGVWTFYEQA